MTRTADLQETAERAGRELEGASAQDVLRWAVDAFGDRFVIASPDTVMSRSSADLVAGSFPDVEVRRELGEHETLLSIDHARRVLGYAPEHSWRDAVGNTP